MHHKLIRHDLFAEADSLASEGYLQLYRLRELSGRHRSKKASDRIPRLWRYYKNRLISRVPASFQPF